MSQELSKNLDYIENATDNSSKDYTERTMIFDIKLNESFERENSINKKLQSKLYINSSTNENNKRKSPSVQKKYNIKIELKSKIHRI